MAPSQRGAYNHKPEDGENSANSTHYVLRPRKSNQKHPKKTVRFNLHAVMIPTKSDLLSKSSIDQVKEKCDNASTANRIRNKTSNKYARLARSATGLVHTAYGLRSFRNLFVRDVRTTSNKRKRLCGKLTNGHFVTDQNLNYAPLHLLQITDADTVQPDSLKCGEGRLNGNWNSQKILNENVTNACRDYSVDSDCDGLTQSVAYMNISSHYTVYSRDPMNAKSTPTSQPCPSPHSSVGSDKSPPEQSVSVDMSSSDAKSPSKNTVNNMNNSAHENKSVHMGNGEEDEVQNVHLDSANENVEIRREIMRPSSSSYLSNRIDNCDDVEMNAAIPIKLHLYYTNGSMSDEHGVWMKAEFVEQPDTQSTERSFNELDCSSTSSLNVEQLPHSQEHVASLNQTTVECSDNNVNAIVTVDNVVNDCGFPKRESHDADNSGSDTKTGDRECPNLTASNSEISRYDVCTSDTCVVSDLTNACPKNVRACIEPSHGADGRPMEKRNESSSSNMDVQGQTSAQNVTNTVCFQSEGQNTSAITTTSKSSAQPSDSQLTGADVNSVANSPRNSPSHLCEDFPHEVHQCPVLGCGQRYTSQAGLREHLSTLDHSPCNPLVNLLDGAFPSPGHFLCPVCGHGFQAECRCEQHMLGEGHCPLLSPVPCALWACPECFLLYASFSAALQHMDDEAHHSAIGSFEEDFQTMNSASPIAVPCRVVTELVTRCQDVECILYCQDCRLCISQSNILLLHLNERHIITAKCHTTVSEVLSSLFTDAACAECRQFIYSGLPGCSLAVHTGCPIQGPVLNIRARSLKEFVLRCGISRLDLLTEDSAEVSGHSLCQSQSTVCAHPSSTVLMASGLSQVSLSRSSDDVFSSHAQFKGNRTIQDVLSHCAEDSQEIVNGSSIKVFGTSGSINDGSEDCMILSQQTTSRNNPLVEGFSGAHTNSETRTVLKGSLPNADMEQRNELPETSHPWCEATYGSGPSGSQDGKETHVCENCCCDSTKDSTSSAESTSGQSLNTELSCCSRADLSSTSSDCSLDSTFREMLDSSWRDIVGPKCYVNQRVCCHQAMETNQSIHQRGHCSTKDANTDIAMDEISMATCDVSEKRDVTKDISNDSVSSKGSYALFYESEHSPKRQAPLQIECLMEKQTMSSSKEQEPEDLTESNSPGPIININTGKTGSHGEIVRIPRKRKHSNEEVVGLPIKMPRTELNSLPIMEPCSSGNTQHYNTVQQEIDLTISAGLNYGTSTNMATSVNQGDTDRTVGHGPSKSLQFESSLSSLIGRLQRRYSEDQSQVDEHPVNVISSDEDMSAKTADVTVIKVSDSDDGFTIYDKSHKSVVSSGIDLENSRFVATNPALTRKLKKKKKPRKKKKKRKQIQGHTTVNAQDRYVIGPALTVFASDRFVITNTDGAPNNTNNHKTNDSTCIRPGDRFVSVNCSEGRPDSSSQTTLIQPGDRFFSENCPVSKPNSPSQSVLIQPGDRFFSENCFVSKPNSPSQSIFIRHGDRFFSENCPVSKPNSPSETTLIQPGDRFFSENCPVSKPNSPSQTTLIQPGDRFFSANSLVSRSDSPVVACYHSELMDSARTHAMNITSEDRFIVAQTPTKEQSVQTQSTDGPVISPDVATSHSPNDTTTSVRPLDTQKTLLTDGCSNGQNSDLVPHTIPSLHLRLDGPTCVSDTPWTCFNRLVSPQISHLTTMRAIVFADLENFWIFKHFLGPWPASFYLWGFISARQNTPFHQEKFFKRFPLYCTLKELGNVHISTQIGTSSNAADFAMTLAIAKLDDRLPANIPFMLVSQDKGFTEVESQMQASRRCVRLIRPGPTMDQSNLVC